LIRKCVVLSPSIRGEETSVTEIQLKLARRASKQTENIPIFSVK